MKLLVLTRYADLGASSRLRTAQYLPHLRDAGIEIVRHSLLDDDYLRSFYGGQRARLSPTGRGYFARWRVLRRISQFDAVMVEKESFPWLPAISELLYYGNAPLWLDYDDAVFHRYDQHRFAAVRSVLGNKHDALMQRANLVTVGNAYLGDRALSAGCRWVERIPTVIDIDRYKIRSRDSTPGDRVVIGWIGSPSTAPYLKLVSPVLQKLALRHRIRCVAIGARRNQLVGTPFAASAWSESTEVASLHGIDIGIMPLPDTPWERGKCGYKLVQYMACGLPVVASPVGVNVEIVREGQNGLLASSNTEWERALETLIVDRSLRLSMGEFGRQRVEAEYCVQVQAPRVAALVKRLAGTPCAA